jgi:hypothetical protein
MTTETVCSTDQARLEKEFRCLRRSVLQEYEAERKLQQELTFRSEKGDQHALETRYILERAGIDLEALQKLDETEQRETAEFLEMARQRLIEREPELERRQREKILRSNCHNRLGAISPPLIGADLMTPKPIPSPPLPPPEETEGELGDSKWFYPGDQTDIKISDEGETWECWPASPTGLRTKRVVYYFLYDHPPQTSTYWILCVWPYHGFYVLNSNDKWWNCRHAGAKVSATLQIHQGFWQGPMQHVIFEKKEQSIHEVGVISGVVNWDFSMLLIGTIPVTFKLTFEIGVTTRYQGTRAEVNFADGSANYVGSPELVVVA